MNRYQRNRPSISLWLTRIALVLTFLLAFLPSRSTNAVPLPQTITSKDRAQALLDTLTPEERVGQLFLVTFNGAEIKPDTPIYNLIINHHIGGVVLQAINDNFVDPPQTINQAHELISQLQNAEWSASQSNQVDPYNNLEFTPAFMPLFVAISQEGDGPPYDQIFNGLTPLPSQMALGATWNPSLAQDIGFVMGIELSSLGINLLLGPSLDVLESPHAESIGDLGIRTFGGDPYWVGEMGRAFITGVHQGSGGRMAVVSKHFPGHGSSDRLPEVEVATVRKSFEELKVVELFPFYAVTGNAPTPIATTDALLVSHIRYQGFQGNIRATTRPVSFDPQAFEQLMSLPELNKWRQDGGLMISDNLGSTAFRRFIDPTGKTFNARFIARDAFLTGNDLLFLGSGFVDTNEPDYYTTVLRTLSFFAQKYREDPAFAQRVDASVLRILTLKFRLYNNNFTLNQVLTSDNELIDLGQYTQFVFNVAQAAATLINPSAVELADSLPQPPGINERIVFFSDTRTAQQCSQCASQDYFSANSLEQAVLRLYGPQASGQALRRNLFSFTFADLATLLDQSDPLRATEIETAIQQAQWLVFALLNVNTDLPTSKALSRFLAERPDLFRDKKLIVFAFNAPYYLDATEISKITAYYGLYSKTAPFVEVAARLLYQEIPAPPGALPVSVPGVGYDLISATSPNPSQIIPLTMDIPPASQPITSPLTPTPTPEFKVGDLIAVRTGVILDHNGHPVPDFTPVQFILTSTDKNPIYQNEVTINGIARTTFLMEYPGTIEIRVESEPAKTSEVLRFDIHPTASEEPSPSPPTLATEPATPEPTIVPTIVLTETPAPHTTHQPDIGDWFLALIASSGLGLMVYRLTYMPGATHWSTRSGFLAQIGGMLAYLYLVLNLPGSELLPQGAGRWSVPILVFLGGIVGWVGGFFWRWLVTHPKNHASTK